MPDRHDEMQVPDLPGTDQSPLEINLSPQVFERLLTLGVTTARAGNKAEARALLRALTRHRPDEVRAWLWLAGVAETFAEQEQALEHVLALDPDHQLAHEGLARLRARLTPAQPAAVVPPSPTAPVATTVPESVVSEDDTAELPSRPNRWLHLVVGLIVILALVFSLGPVGWGRSRVPEGAAPPTPPLPAPGFAASLSNGTSPTGSTETVVPTLMPPTPTVVLPPTSPPAALTPLPVGNVVQHDGWQATLLRPDYARTIDGAVGDVRPDGRFVLTLLAVSNATDTPRRIPLDLFVLTDAQGRSYTPDPVASVSYLVVYPAGQWGDLAIDDEVPPGAGLYTMPLLFDIPLDATNLLLTMGQRADAGWLILDHPPPATGS